MLAVMTWGGYDWGEFLQSVLPYGLLEKVLRKRLLRLSLLGCWLSLVPSSKFPTVSQTICGA